MNWIVSSVITPVIPAYRRHCDVANSPSDDSNPWPVDLKSNVLPMTPRCFMHESVTFELCSVENHIHYVRVLAITEAKNYSKCCLPIFSASTITQIRNWIWTTIRVKGLYNCLKLYLVTNCCFLNHPSSCIVGTAGTESFTNYNLIFQLTCKLLNSYFLYCTKTKIVTYDVIFMFHCKQKCIEC